MNKAFSLFALLLALSVFVTACSSKTEPAVSPEPIPTGAAEPTTPAQDAAVDAVVVSETSEVQLGELV